MKLPENSRTANAKAATSRQREQPSWRATKTINRDPTQRRRQPQRTFSAMGDARAGHRGFPARLAVQRQVSAKFTHFLDVSAAVAAFQVEKTDIPWVLEQNALAGLKREIHWSGGAGSGGVSRATGKLPWRGSLIFVGMASGGHGLPVETVISPKTESARGFNQAVERAGVDAQVIAQLVHQHFGECSLIPFAAPRMDLTSTTKSPGMALPGQGFR